MESSQAALRGRSVRLTSLSDMFLLMQVITAGQTSANRGPDLTFINEANSTMSSPKPSSSKVIKLMEQVKSTLIMTIYLPPKQVIGESASF